MQYAVFHHVFINQHTFILLFIFLQKFYCLFIQTEWSVLFMTDKKENRSVVRTQLLLKDGLTNLMHQKPVQKISVKELTDYVNLNRGTFYLHYKDIYDLLEQIENDMLIEFQEINSTHKVAEMDGKPYPLLLDLFILLQKNAEFARILLINNRDQNFVDKLKNIIRERCLPDLIYLFSGADPALCNLYTSYILAGCIGIIENWLESSPRCTPEVLAHRTEDIILHGLDIFQN